MRPLNRPSALDPMRAYGWGALCLRLGAAIPDAESTPLWLSIFGSAPQMLGLALVVAAVPMALISVVRSRPPLLFWRGVLMVLLGMIGALGVLAAFFWMMADDRWTFLLGAEAFSIWEAISWAAIGILPARACYSPRAGEVSARATCCLIACVVAGVAVGWLFVDHVWLPEAYGFFVLVGSPVLIASTGLPFFVAQMRSCAAETHCVQRVPVEGE